MAEFKWIVEKVENLIIGFKNLMGSRVSSFDTYKLLLSKRRWIYYHKLKILRLKLKKKWKTIIGKLRWLLGQSLLYNFNSNNDTEANFYFSNISQK